MKKYSKVMVLKTNLQTISIPKRKSSLRSFWYVDYKPFFLYRNAIIKNSLGIVFHFVTGDN